MKYLPTAFAQLSFAWKIYHYASEGNINRNELDIDIKFEDNGIVFMPPSTIFDNDNDLILAFENNLVIAFGAAAITLYRSIEENGVRLPDPIDSEFDHAVSLAYQIRNAFAHDIAEPRWRVTKERYKRELKFGQISVNLASLHGETFDYRHIGGPDTLFRMKDYFSNHFGPMRPA